MNNGKNTIYEKMFEKFIESSYWLYILDLKVKLVDSAIPVLFVSGKYLLAVTENIRGGAKETSIVKLVRNMGEIMGTKPLKFMVIVIISNWFTSWIIIHFYWNKSLLIEVSCL